MRTAFLFLFLEILIAPSPADDGNRLLTIDHYVRVQSTVPSIAGQNTQIYVREIVRAATVMREGGLNRVILFVHGAGTPAEVAFDAPYQDYSWMQYLARAGFDVFSMDMTGYGRSTRPPVMNDACNLSPEQQLAFVPNMLPKPCTPAYAQHATTLASDWNDIGAVVDRLLALRHAERVGIVGWSLGGPRSAGYTAQHPDKVRSLVLLAPAYNREAHSNPPAQIPAKGIVFNTQSHDEFLANWTRQVGCPEQVDPAAAQAVWTAMLESDPVGATWGTGVRRAPQVTTWGWNRSVAEKMRTPMLLVAGAFDKQVPPDRVRDLYTDLGSSQKVFVDLACSSHNALWEKNHLLLFQASLEWFSNGTVNGTAQGVLKLGYSTTP